MFVSYQCQKLQLAAINAQELLIFTFVLYIYTAQNEQRNNTTTLVTCNLNLVVINRLLIDYCYSRNPSRESCDQCVKSDDMFFSVCVCLFYSVVYSVNVVLFCNIDNKNIQYFFFFVCLFWGHHKAVMLRAAGLAKTLFILNQSN